MRHTPILLALCAAACTSELPPGTTSFTVGRTTVRVDSTLDLVGLVLRLADTGDIPTVGPLTHWNVALGTELGDSAFTLARALGPTPVGPVLEAYASPATPDSVCGWLAPGVRRCFGGNGPSSARSTASSSPRAPSPRAPRRSRSRG